jgi:hypothetical protein
MALGVPEDGVTLVYQLASSTGSIHAFLAVRMPAGRYVEQNGPIDLADVSIGSRGQHDL